MADPQGGDGDEGEASRKAAAVPAADNPVDRLFRADRSMPAPAIEDRPSVTEMSRWEATRSSLFAPDGSLPPPPPPVPIDTIPPLPPKPMRAKVEPAKPKPPESPVTPEAPVMPEAPVTPEPAPSLEADLGSSEPHLGGEPRLSDDLDIDDLERASGSKPAARLPEPEDVQSLDEQASPRASPVAEPARARRGRSTMPVALGGVGAAVALGAWLALQGGEPEAAPGAAPPAAQEAKPLPPAAPPPAPPPTPVAAEPVPTEAVKPAEPAKPEPPVAVPAVPVAVVEPEPTPAPEPEKVTPPPRPKPVVMAKPPVERPPKPVPVAKPAPAPVEPVPGPAEDSSKIVLEARRKLDDDDGRGAEALMRELLVREPGNLLAREMLAKALIDQDRGAEAVLEAKQVVQRRPSHVPSWLLLGDAHLLAGDDAAAEKAWRKALELRPADIGAKQRLGM